MDRRDFIRNTSIGMAGLSVVGPGILTASPSVLPAGLLTRRDTDARAIALAALDAARAAGADYGDARVQRVRRESLSTREHRVQNITSSETYGLGVRVLVDGSWGFAASRELDADSVALVARRAVDQARANRRLRREPVQLAPVEVYTDARYATPIEVDPWDVPIEEKVELLLAANAAALTVPSVRFVNSSMFFHTEDTTFASTEGSVIEQTLYRARPLISATAVSDDRSDFQTRSSTEVAPLATGYEYIHDADLVGNAPRWAEEAAAKLGARPVEPGEYDLILDPTHLWLTIHENIGHPTELDRARGYEANYAGTSLLAPPEAVIGRFRYGPEFMNVVADRTQERALSTTGWDHEGVRAREWHIVKDGLFVDYQTTREQVAWIAELTGDTRSHGTSYAQSWSDVQFQRMPNVSLMPGEEDLTVEDLIAATERGIYIFGDGSFSIDQQRFNFQFGGQAFYEIRDGRITGMLKDVAYQGRTPDFYNSMDMIGGPRSYFLGGALNDGKGQPSQSNAVSHGCPPARFRSITVINTGR